MTEALLLIGLVNGGLWLLLWVMAGLEPPHPHLEPAGRESERAAAIGGAERPDRHLSRAA